MSINKLFTKKQKERTFFFLKQVVLFVLVKNYFWTFFLFYLSIFLNVFFSGGNVEKISNNCDKKNSVIVDVHTKKSQGETKLKKETLGEKFYFV